MRYYRCDTNNTNGHLTKNKVYGMKKVPGRSTMHYIYYYDNEKEPGLLNDYWFENHFKLTVNLPLNIKIL